MLNYTQNKNNSLVQFKQNNQGIPIQNIQCCSKQQAVFFCLNGLCKQKQPFICGKKKCQCRKLHKQYSKGDIQFAYKQLKNKLVDINLIKNEIDSIIQDAIDSLSNLRETLISIINNKMEHIKMTDKQFNFLQFLEGKNDQGFSGQIFRQIWSDINLKDRQKNYKDPITIKIKEFESSCYQQIKIVNNSFQKFFKMLKYKLKAQTDLLVYKLTEESNILKDMKDATIFIQFFGEANVKDCNLLWRAKQNNFSLANFYQICGREGDLAIICKSNKNKILGGYSHVQFIGQQQGWIEDESKSSFIFSVTNGDRFDLVRSQRELSFGNNELRIKQFNSELSLQKGFKIGNICDTHINWHYLNSNYLTKDKQSYKKLNGNQKHQFYLLDWQCWKIQYQK